jgi:hypothetical protein
MTPPTIRTIEANATPALREDLAKLLTTHLQIELPTDVEHVQIIVRSPAKPTGPTQAGKKPPRKA